MVKGWADHCSSDEEDEVVDREERTLDSTHDNNNNNKGDDLHPPQEEHGEKEHHHHRHQQQQPRGPRTYDFPTEPPFTAYVGNLAYSIDKREHLVQEMTELAKRHLDLDIRIVNARIAFDTRGERPRPRGFGYVTVETLEQLQGLMKLNEVSDGVQLGGRRIHVDTANKSSSTNTRATSNNHNREDKGTPSDSIDGTKFRGGRYGNNRDQGRHHHHGNRDHKDSAGKEGQDAPPPPAQRASLKLAPRSKPDGGDHDDGDKHHKANNIFGSGRARDEQDWRERKTTTNSNNNEQQVEQKQQHRHRGRATAAPGMTGKDRSGSGTRGGKDRHHQHDGKDRDAGRQHHNKTYSHKKQQQRTTEEKKGATTPVVPQPKAEPPKAVTKVSNTFAALDFSDSDSD